MRPLQGTRPFSLRKRSRWGWVLFLLGCALIAVAGGAPDGTAAASWQSQVEAILGRKGKNMPGDVLRITLTRDDLTPVVAGVSTLPNLTVDGYAAFRQSGSQALIVAELPLLDREINPVISAIEAGGLHLTAQHNHFMFASPALLFVHLDGVGDPVRMAEALENALRLTGLPRTHEEQSASAGASDLDQQKLEQILGHPGHMVEGVLEFTVDRAERFTDRGLPMPAAMAPETEMHFQPLGGGKAAVAAEIAVRPDEIDRVTKVLRDNAALVTALHNHLVDEKPRLYWVHAWFTGNPESIAQTLKMALDRTNSK